MMNNKKKILLSVLLGLGFFLTVYSYIFIYQPMPFWVRKQINENREELSSQLGVNLKNYADPELFPYKYYIGRLYTGMPITDVHKIMKGYQRVFHCAGTERYEKYFYLHSKDIYAEIYQIKYDELLKIEYIEVGSPPSQTLRGYACVEGLLN